jgi:porin
MANYKFLCALLALSGAALFPLTAAAGQKDAAHKSIWEQETLTGDWGGARKAWEDAGIKFGLTEQSEGWASLTGGKRTGSSYNGLTTPSLQLDLDKLMHWHGATFFVNALQIHGFGPTAQLVGNQQIVSGIEATPSTKLYQLWIEQQFFKGRVSVRVGQEGTADELMTVPSAALFLNASFGAADILPQNLPGGAPNYPLATPMVRTQVKLTEEITFVNAVFNGDPAGRGEGDPQLRNESGTAFRMSDPPLIFNEFWFQRGQDPKSRDLPGTYKIGAWVHTGKFDDLAVDKNGLSLSNPLSSGIPRVFHGNYAFYVIADQMIWRKAGTKDEGISLFGQMMVTPDDMNAESLYAEAGVNWKGMLRGRPDDVAGLAVAYARTSDALRRSGTDSIAFTGSGKRHPADETVLEATYLYKVAPWWSIQPDLQYIINPGAVLAPSGTGVEAPLKDAVIAGVRTKIEF